MRLNFISRQSCDGQTRTEKQQQIWGETTKWNMNEWRRGNSERTGFVTDWNQLNTPRHSFSSGLTLLGYCRKHGGASCWTPWRCQGSGGLIFSYFLFYFGRFILMCHVLLSSSCLCVFTFTCRQSLFFFLVFFPELQQSFVFFISLYFFILLYFSCLCCIFGFWVQLYFDKDKLLF